MAPCKRADPPSADGAVSGSSSSDFGSCALYTRGGSVSVPRSSFAAAGSSGRERISGSVRLGPLRPRGEPTRSAPNETAEQHAESRPAATE
jgi:hypothetical protein